MSTRSNSVFFGLGAKRPSGFFSLSPVARRVVRPMPVVRNRGSSPLSKQARKELSKQHRVSDSKKLQEQKRKIVCRESLKALREKRGVLAEQLKCYRKSGQDPANESVEF